MVCLAVKADVLNSRPTKKKAGKRVGSLAGLKKVPRLKPAPTVNGEAGVVAALLEERRNGR
jgi:hypothetical protein